MCEIINLEIKKDIINNIHIQTKNNEKDSEKIFETFKNNIIEDLKTILSQTTLDQTQAYYLYKENNFNVVDSITNYIDPNFTNTKDDKNIKPLSETQRKINELRDIANFKDAYYEQIKKNH